MRKSVDGMHALMREHLSLNVLTGRLPGIYWNRLVPALAGLIPLLTTVSSRLGAS